MYININPIIAGDFITKLSPIERKSGIKKSLEKHPCVYVCVGVPEGISASSETKCIWRGKNENPVQLPLG